MNAIDYTYALCKADQFDGLSSDVVLEYTYGSEEIVYHASVLSDALCTKENM